jgi:UDP-glucose 4-epimerase
LTVLITGGAGFIGSYVTQFFDENGDHMVLIDKIEHLNNGRNMSSIRADINDLSALEKTMLDHDISTVIHLVGMPHIGECEKNPQLSFQLNTLSTQKIVEAMRKADVKKIIFASSASVYGYQVKEKVREEDLPKPDTVYGFHKLLAEQIIKSYNERYGIGYVILRLFNIYGGDPTKGKDIISLFIRKMLNGEPLILMGENKFRDFIHVKDVAHSFYKVYNSRIKDKTINIGSGVKITFSQLTAIFKIVTPYLKVVVENTTDDGTGMYADITLAKALLGFNIINPIVGIRNHIKRYSKLMEKYQALKEDRKSLVGISH